MAEIGIEAAGVHPGRRNGGKPSALDFRGEGHQARIDVAAEGKDFQPIAGESEGPIPQIVQAEGKLILQVRKHHGALLWVPNQDRLRVSFDQVGVVERLRGYR